jgi:hypothetical protein
MRKKVYITELLLGCNVLQTTIFQVDGRLPGAVTTEEDMQNMRIAAETLMRGIRLYIKQEMSA